MAEHGTVEIRDEVTRLLASLEACRSKSLTHDLWGNSLFRFAAFAWSILFLIILGLVGIGTHQTWLELDSVRERSSAAFLELDRVTGRAREIENSLDNEKSRFEKYLQRRVEEAAARPLTEVQTAAQNAITAVNGLQRSVTADANRAMESIVTTREELDQARRKLDETLKSLAADFEQLKALKQSHETFLEAAPQEELAHLRTEIEGLRTLARTAQRSSVVIEVSPSWVMWLVVGVISVLACLGGAALWVVSKK